MRFSDSDAPRTTIELPDLERLDRDQIDSSVVKWAVRLHEGGIGNSPTTPLIVRGCPVFLKREDLNPTGAYKERGATSAMIDAVARGFHQAVLASTGNFAKGVGSANKKQGLAATVFVPTNTPPDKLAAVEATGMTVHREGATFTEAQLIAERFAANHPDYVLLEPYDAAATIVGQASVAHELIRDVGDDYDTIVCPVGGGGLLSGTALSHFGARRDTRIVGVCSEAARALYLAHRAKEYMTFPTRPSIANGVSVSRPGRRCWTVIERLVDEIVYVTDAEIDDAIDELAKRGIRAEGAGAVAFAALLSNRTAPGLRSSKGIAAIVSGGNISDDDFNAARARARLAWSA